MRTLLSLDLHGFKSIRALPDFEFGDVNVLIGPNGAGKSNLLAFLRLLKWMVTPPGELQINVARMGGAYAVLHYGARVTPSLRARLSFVIGRNESATAGEYAFELTHAAGDSLIFSEEIFRAGRGGGGSRSGHREARIIEPLRGLSPDDVAPFDQVREGIADTLRGIGWFHFRDTSDTARIRQRWPVDDSHQLKEDGGNLAPFLYRLARERPAHYARITETLRQVIPQFADFVLPLGDTAMLLQWRERESDVFFGPGQASDGMLRLMALVALLLQPAEDLPPVLIVDEPELGLHPSAIHLVAGLLLAASQQVQVIVATQSPALLDHFEPEQIVVVDRPGGESTFRRLDSVHLDEWLEEYTMAELWEKNVLGGKPA
jgi:predicted ATPase